MKGKVLEFNGVKPTLHPSVFLADGSFVIGDVEIGEGSSVWYNTVVRGDVNYIKIGRFTNIQDLSMIHVTTAKYPTIIGDYVTVGHKVMIHGAKIGNYVLVGIGAIILDDAEIPDHVIVAAGSVIPPGKKYPSGVLIMGTPGKVVRELTRKEMDYFEESAIHYYELARKHSLIKD